MDNTDNLAELGFIDKEKLLQYVSQEEIFQLVFGFLPKESEFVTSPFRDDENPGCYFEYNEHGKLKFIDFGSTYKSIDCFDAVKIHYRLSNFYKTLAYISDVLIKGKKLEKRPAQEVTRSFKEANKRSDIFIQPRDFIGPDRIFWTKYGISKQNLIDDKVFPLSKLKVTNTKLGDITSDCYDITYAYTNFKENRKKIYRPMKKGKKRFITNCKANDIGELSNLPATGERLIISKSYKDCRVLRNQSLNSIWFQNEGMYPDEDILIPLCERFENVDIFFDNDRTGIEAAVKLNEILDTYHSNVRAIWLPEYMLDSQIKDPSDLIEKKDEKELKLFLKHSEIL